MRGERKHIRKEDLLKASHSPLQEMELTDLGLVYIKRLTAGELSEIHRHIKVHYAKSDGKDALSYVQQLLVQRSVVDVNRKSLFDTVDEVGSCSPELFGPIIEQAYKLNPFLIADLVRLARQRYAN